MPRDSVGLSNWKPWHHVKRAALRGKACTILLSYALSTREDRVSYRTGRLHFHFTFSASKCYHPNDMSVTESVNTSEIQVESAGEPPFKSPDLNVCRTKLQAASMSAWD